MMRALLFATLFLAAPASAAALYFCVAPPTPCQSLTQLTSWTFSSDGHYIVVSANGHDYGRAAVGTYYAVPNSVIVRDSLFKAGFE